MEQSLDLTIAGFGIQPSEFVKILFVFFVAANLNRSLEFKNIVITTALAAAHVLILVLSTDLGTALILFVVYLVMLYTATRQPLYVAAVSEAVRSLPYWHTIYLRTFRYV